MGEPQMKISLPPALAGLVFCYERAVELFNPESVAQSVKKSIPRSDTNIALMVFGLSCLIVFLMALATSLISVYMVNYASDLIEEVRGMPQPSLELDSLAPVAMYQFILYAVAGLFIALLFEGVTYSMIRVSGGKGGFRQQLFVAATISLAFSFSTVLSVLMPLPLLNFLGGLAILAVTAYLAFYVTAKAYSMVHEISFMHALVVVIVAGIPRVAAILFLMSVLATAFGLASPIEIPQGG